MGESFRASQCLKLWFYVIHLLGAHILTYIDKVYAGSALHVDACIHNYGS